MARKSALVAVIFAFISAATVAEVSAQDASVRWVAVTFSANGDFVSYDSRTIRRDGDLVTAWVSYDSPVENDSAPRAWKRALQREQFNCTAMTAAVLSSVRYDEKSNVLSSSSTETQPEPIPPDSVWEALWFALCT